MIQLAMRFTLPCPHAAGTGFILDEGRLTDGDAADELLLHVGADDLRSFDGELHGRLFRLRAEHIARPDEQTQDRPAARGFQNAFLQSESGLIAPRLHDFHFLLGSANVVADVLPFQIVQAFFSPRSMASSSFTWSSLMASRSFSSAS